MYDDTHIPSKMKPAIDKLHNDLSAVLTDYEEKRIDAEDLYDFMVGLQGQLALVVYEN